jgi:hypothetical protein
MDTDKMAKALATAGSSTAIVANISAAGGLTVTAVGAPAIIVGAGAAFAIVAIGYGACLGYGAIKKKLDGSD